MNTTEIPVMVCFAERFVDPGTSGGPVPQGKRGGRARRAGFKCAKWLWWIIKWTAIVMFMVAVFVITIPLAFFAS